MKAVFKELKEFAIEEAKRSPAYLAFNTFLLATVVLLAIFAVALLAVAIAR